LTYSDPSLGSSSGEWPPDRTTSEDDLADAHSAIVYASTWVNSADTKAGFLAAMSAVVIAAISQQTDEIGVAIQLAGNGRPVPLVLLVLVGSALAVALVALAFVITPRTPPPQAPSRFGFPTLASRGWKRVRATRAQAAEEAWDQARVLSRVARAKFKALRVAAVAEFLSVFLYAAWTVTVSLPG
jgi:hypothetical protein